MKENNYIDNIVFDKYSDKLKFTRYLVSVGILAIVLILLLSLFAKKHTPIELNQKSQLVNVAKNFDFHQSLSQLRERVRLATNEAGSKFGNLSAKESFNEVLERFSDEDEAPGAAGVDAARTGEASGVANGEASGENVLALDATSEVKEAELDAKMSKPNLTSNASQTQNTSNAVALETNANLLPPEVVPFSLQTQKAQTQNTNKAAAKSEELGKTQAALTKPNATKTANLQTKNATQASRATTQPKQTTQKGEKAAQTRAANEPLTPQVRAGTYIQILSSDRVNVKDPILTQVTRLGFTPKPHKVKVGRAIVVKFLVGPYRSDTILGMESLRNDLYEIRQKAAPDAFRYEVGR